MQTQRGGEYEGKLHPAVAESECTSQICRRCERSERPSIPLSAQEDTGASCNDLDEWERALCEPPPVRLPASTRAAQIGGHD